MYKIGMTTSVEDLRYPGGRFTPSMPGGGAVRREAIEQIAALPVRMRHAVSGLTDAQLDTPYRPDGWTVRQVVHHVADSHMNGFTRIKLALTEQNPTIKPYDEKAFAELGDVRLPIGVSLDLLTALHARWIALYEVLREEQFTRTFFYHATPEPLTFDP